MKNNNIYHFTNLESLKSIILSNQLRFSLVERSNDPSEGEYSRNLIIKYIKKNIKNVEKQSNVISFFNINTTKRYNLDDYESKLDLFAISFTNDLNNVHNWMEYGDYGKGAAISFDKEKLENELKNLEPYLKFKNAIYSEEEVLEFIFGLDKKLDEYLYSEELVKIYPLIKHPSYKVEDEYRIVFVEKLEEKMLTAEQPANISNKSLFKIDVNNVKFFLNFEKLMVEKIVNEIILGFGVSIEEYIKLNLFLKTNNFDIKVRFSDVPICRRSN